MARRGENDWCILRTSGSSTLRLSQSLARAGFEVWTPMELQVKGRGSQARSERMVAVMPSYVFARADRLPDLVSLTMEPISPHPPFSVFKHLDRFPLIAERELKALRDIETKAAARNEPVIFGQGDLVRARVEAFQGLTGEVVETSRGQFTLVAFPKFAIPVKFASWQLNAVELQSTDSAAKAA